MDLNLIIEDAISNPVKFTRDDLPTNERASFDQQRYAQAHHTTTDEGKTYNQLWEKLDTIRIQFYSNFPNNRVKVVDCQDNVIGPLMYPSVAVDYRNKFWRSSCKFSSIGDKLFIYFSETQVYLDEDFTELGPMINFEGRLPNINAQPGDVVRYSLDGVTFLTTTIVSTQWNPALQAEGYVTSTDITLITPVLGLVEINYDEKPANLYTQLISLAALASGKYFLKREHGVTDYSITYTSEPLDVQDEHAETLALEYKHVGTYNRADLWSYVYLFDWTNKVRIPAAFYKWAPAGEIDLDVNDYGTPRLLRAVPYRQVELNFFNMPNWLADKVQMALSHDVKIINGYEWEMENFGGFDLIDRINLGTYTVALRQKTDRTKKIDVFPFTLSAEFVPPIHHALPYAGFETYSQFVTNTAGEFHFVSLPPWIIPDKATFVNGDIINFVITANPELFDRAAVLVAVCDTIDGLNAELSFSQYYNDAPPPQFLSTNRNTIRLPYPFGFSELVNVSSSGDYTISYSGPFTFVAVKESGFTKVRISSPSANTTTTDRVGVVRLTLNSNPAIFKDIAVSQAHPTTFLTSTEPTEVSFPAKGGNRTVDIFTTEGTEWQAVPSHPWVVVDGSIHTGNYDNFNIHCNGTTIDTVTPRYAVVTFVNIANPGNTLVVNIEQN